MNDKTQTLAELLAYAQQKRAWQQKVKPTRQPAPQPVVSEDEFAKLPKVVGENLRRIRRNKPLSQSRLAALAGVDEKTVTRLEQGSHKVQLPTLYALAKALEVQVYDLLPKIEEVA